MKLEEIKEDGKVVKVDFKNKKKVDDKEEPKSEPAKAEKLELIDVFGSKEMATLHHNGIKLTEKPGYWEDFEGDGYAAKRNIHEVALKKAEKLLGGKFAEYTGKEIFGYDHKPKSPLVNAKHPEQDMFIVNFSDGTSYLCDVSGASTYIRNWQKIVK